MTVAPDLIAYGDGGDRRVGAGPSFGKPSFSPDGATPEGMATVAAPLAGESPLLPQATSTLLIGGGGGGPGSPAAGSGLTTCPRRCQRPGAATSGEQPRTYRH
ncbi:MAG: hypothetical protein R2932_55370 [Caldilineaceae bacterium]